jgi:hypothetical protein
MIFSLRIALCVLMLLPVAMMASPARADSRQYCIAYARDLADRKVLLSPSAEAVVNPASDTVTATASISTPSDEERKLEARWRGSYKSALQACLDQYSDGAAKPVALAPKLVVPAKPPAADSKTEKQASASPTGPKRGSEEWKKKCLAAHPSFNAETGTYRTYSGAQRECRLN